MRFALSLLILLAATPAFAQPTVPAAKPYREAVAELEKIRTGKPTTPC